MWLATEQERFIAPMPWDSPTTKEKTESGMRTYLSCFIAKQGPSEVLASSPGWATEDGTLPARLRSVFPGARHESAGFAGKHVKGFSQVPGTSVRRVEA
jgi:hypothetical protein